MTKLITTGGWLKASKGDAETGINGTDASFFTINEDLESTDTEDSSLVINSADGANLRTVTGTFKAANQTIDFNRGLSSPYRKSSAVAKSAILKGDALISDGGKVKPWDSGIISINDLLLINTGGSGITPTEFIRNDETTFFGVFRSGSPTKSVVRAFSWDGTDPSVAVTAGTAMDFTSGPDYPGIIGKKIGTDKIIVASQSTGNSGPLEAAVISMNTSTLALTNETKANNSGNNVTVVSDGGLFGDPGRAQIVVDSGASDRFLLMYIDSPYGSAQVKIRAGRKDTHAVGTITIVDYSGLSTDTFTVRGQDYVEGTNFNAVTSNDQTATNLAAAITANDSANVYASASGAVVTITAVTGDATTGNAYSLATTDGSNSTVSGATLAGGLDDVPSFGTTNTISMSNFSGPLKASMVCVADGIFHLYYHSAESGGQTVDRPCNTVNVWGLYDSTIYTGSFECIGATLSGSSHNYGSGPWGWNAMAKVGTNRSVAFHNAGHNRGAYLTEISTEGDILGDANLAPYCPYQFEPQRLLFPENFALSRSLVAIDEDTILVTSKYCPQNPSWQGSKGTSWNMASLSLCKRKGDGAWEQSPGLNPLILAETSYAIETGPFEGTVLKTNASSAIVVLGFLASGNTYLRLAEIDTTERVFMGVADANYDTDDTAYFYIPGSIAPVFTGKVAGDKMYIKYDGSLSTDLNTIRIGEMVSNTDLLITYKSPTLGGLYG